MKLQEVHESLDTIGADIVEKLLDKGERIWVSRQGRVGQGVLKGIRQSQESLDGEHYFDIIELEVDVQPTKGRDHWRTNWWTISAEQFSERFRLRKESTARPGAGRTEWLATILQPKKLKEGEGALETMGFDFMVDKVKKDEPVAVTKSTIMSLTNEHNHKGFNLNTKRHGLLEAVLYDKGRQYPVFNLLMPAKTSYWVVVPIEMGPELQEGWMIKKFKNGWLAWREDHES